MDKNKIRIIVELLSFFLAALVIFSLFFFTSEDKENNNSIPSVISLGVVALVVNIASIIVSRILRNKSEYEVLDKNVIKLNKIIQYDKKRREIEEEIEKLTRELLKSDVSQYIDTNRLAFSGQNGELKPGQSDTFIKQFGLNSESIKIKNNCAVFLTPFNAEGEKLFTRCQAILSKANVFLQKTDNLVEKDDILMNIVTLIVQAELVLVNIDGRNPNVYYELGMAHALGKPTILLSSADYSLEDIGFDIRQKRIIIYHDENELETELLYQLNRIKKF